MVEIIDAPGDHPVTTPKNKITPERAVSDMLAAGLQPLEPYRNCREPWRCKCLSCGTETRPRLYTIRQGTGGCRTCGNERIRKTLLGDVARAVADMLAAGLQPLDPYPGTMKQWRSLCLRCGEEVTPRLCNVRRGQTGCRTCRYRKAGETRRVADPETALAELQAAGFEPLEPYPGGVARPWRCLCLRCGNEAKPRIRRLRQGESGCRYCAAFGIDFSAPASLYVVHHAGHGAVKVGISGAGKGRLASFQRAGWAVHATVPFPEGMQAHRVEQAVLKRLRVGMGLQQFLTPECMGRLGGATETFDAELIGPRELCALVREERDRHTLAARAIAPAKV